MVRHGRHRHYETRNGFVRQSTGWRNVTRGGYYRRKNFHRRSGGEIHPAMEKRTAEIKGHNSPAWFAHFRTFRLDHGKCETRRTAWVDGRFLEAARSAARPVHDCARRDADALRAG